MLGLTSLEVYNSLCNKSKQNNKFELHKGIYTEFTFMDLKKELEEIFNIEDIKLEHLQDHKIGPLIFKFYEKLKSEKSTTDAYLILLANYARSPFGDFKSFLGLVIGLDEDNIQLSLKQYNSNFVTIEIPPVFTQLKKFQRFVIEIKKEPYELNIMVLG